MIDTAALRAVIEERLRLARAALDDEIFDGTGIVIMRTHHPALSRSVTIASHIATFLRVNDPAFVLRQCERDLRVLDRHQPREYVPSECSACFESTHQTYQDNPICTRVDWPCPEVLDLAVVWTPTDTQEQT